MTYSISFFQGDQTNVDRFETVIYGCFEDLTKDKRLTHCYLGKKHRDYFTRGEVTTRRSDAGIPKSQLLIIDGDMGGDGGNAPEPIMVAAALDKLNINFILTTTHSHAVGKNKFRVLVPTQSYEKHELKRNISLLLRKLKKHGVDIKHVKEMSTWSQAWYFPKRDDPKDGLYEYYAKIDGNDWELEHVEKDEAASEEEQEKGREDGTVETLDQMHEVIRQGTDGMHPALRTLSYQYIQDGMSKANCKAVMKSLMNGSKEAGTQRWQDRYDDIDRLVDKVVMDDKAKDADFELESLGAEVELKEKLPIPPGLTGELYKSAYDFLLLQSEEVAFAATFGAIAGVVGRKFNSLEPMPSGLNVFITIIANTGCGKDRINDFVRLCLTSAQDSVKSYSSFIAPSHFYGPKAIVDHFMEARSGVSIISESGLMMKVKSGAVEAKTAFMLDALQCSHQGGYTKAHGYSKSEDSLPEVRAMAMSVISESTPEMMFEAYNETGALKSGYLPRQICLRVQKPIVESNRNIVQVLPDKMADRFHELCETCSAVQAEDNPSAHILSFDEGLLDDYYDYYDNFLAIREANNGVDEVRSNMASRAAQKAIRLASLATVFNKQKGDPKCLVIEAREWEWAKKFCNYEYEQVSGALGGMVGDQKLENCVAAIYSKILGILDDSIKNGKCKVNIRYRKAMIIPYGKLKIACSQNQNITALNDKQGAFMSGLDKGIKDMVKNNAIEVLDIDPLGGRAPVTLRVLGGMTEYIKAYGAS